jgi:hypothetical protein
MFIYSHASSPKVPAEVKAPAATSSVDRPQFEVAESKGRDHLWGLPKEFR